MPKSRNDNGKAKAQLGANVWSKDTSVAVKKVTAIAALRSIVGKTKPRIGGNTECIGLRRLVFPDYGNSKKWGEVLTVDLDDLRVEGSKFEQSERHLEAGVVLGAPEEQKVLLSGYRDSAIGSPVWHHYKP